MFNKKNKTEKKNVKKVLKIVLYAGGGVVILGIIYLFIYLFISVIFYEVRCDESRMNQFVGEIFDPCFVIYDSSFVIKRWPIYASQNDRVCITTQVKGCWGENSHFKTISLPDADPNTFEELDYDYSKDKNNVYYDDQKIQGADPNTFEIIDCVFSKDKNHKYSFGKMVK